MSRKSIIALCAAQIVVVCALFAGTTVFARRSNTPSPDGGLTLAAPSCEAGAAVTSRGQSDFGHGTLTAALSQGKLVAGAGGDVYLSVDLNARQAPLGDRPPMSLAIVVDRSGSMSGDKIEYARQAAASIIDRMGPRDRAALVQYDDAAQVLVPLTTTDGAGKELLRTSIRGIAVAGGTNLHDGMALGRDEVLRAVAPGVLNRVILLSDGQANVGISDTPMLGSVAAVAAERGVRITAVGVGLDYNEDLMELLAERGRGQYYYVKDAAGLEKVLAGEVAAMQATVATNAELRLEPTCGAEIMEIHGYVSRREGNAVIVPLADVFGGDRRKVVVRLRTPRAASGATSLVQATLGFRDARGGQARSASVQVGVGITADASAAEKTIDRDVMTQVLQIEGARAMRDAAKDFEAGRSKEASEKLEVQRAQMMQKASTYGIAAPALAKAMAPLQEMSADVAAAPPLTSNEGKALLKKSKQDALRMSK